MASEILRPSIEALSRVKDYLLSDVLPGLSSEDQLLIVNYIEFSELVKIAVGIIH